MAASSTLPVIHLSWDPQTLAERLRQAANTSGFFYLLDHGIDPEEIQQAFTLSKEFFENTPTEERVKYAFDTTAGCVGLCLPELSSRFPKIPYRIVDFPNMLIGLYWNPSRNTGCHANAGRPQGVILSRTSVTTTAGFTATIR